MTDWIEWNGGECPVSEDTVVEVRYRAEAVAAKGIRIDWPCPAGRFEWWHDGEDDDIVTYRKWEPEYE